MAHAAKIGSRRRVLRGDRAAFGDSSATTPVWSSGSWPVAI